MRIFNAEGRRRNQTGATTPVAGSIPMSDKLGVDDGLLEGGRRGVSPEQPEVEPVNPEERPRRERPRNNPPPPWKPPIDQDGEYHPTNSPPNSYAFSYATKKNIAQGMMDLALLTANASQLRYIMRSPVWDLYHRINVTLISISIALQIIAGIMLIFIGRYDFKRKEGRYLPQILSDVVVLVIFVITVVNIFIAAFGVDDERTTFLRWKEESTGVLREPFVMPINAVPPGHHP